VLPLLQSTPLSYPNLTLLISIVVWGSLVCRRQRSSWPGPGPSRRPRRPPASTRRRSNLDLRSEARVARLMGALSRGRTTVIVATGGPRGPGRPHPVLAGGRVVEEWEPRRPPGPHGSTPHVGAGDPEPNRGFGAGLPTSEAASYGCNYSLSSTPRPRRSCRNGMPNIARGRA